MNTGIEHTSNEWALEFGKDDATIRRRLVKAGFKVEARTLIRARDVFIAMNSDKDMDLRRKIKAEADLLEGEVEREAGNTFYWDEVQKLITDYVILPISQLLNNIPSTYCTLCNPMDSLLAHKALEQLVNDLKKTLRDKLPKPDK